MNRVKQILFVVFTMISGSVIAQTNKHVALKVVVTGDMEQQGSVLLALYDSEVDFLTKELIGNGLTATGNELIFEFDSLKEGKRYAVAVFHDLNNNKKMDKNMFGIPSEPYAFGNNSMGFMGPPSFFDASILLKPTDNVMVIKID